MSLTADPTTATTAPALPIQPVGDEVIVWSKPRCVQCTATERALVDFGIPHRIIDLTEHPDALQVLREANFLQAPVVQHGTDVWLGFRPDKIADVAARVA